MRRQSHRVIGLAVAIGATVALIGCGSDKETTADSSTTAAVSESTAASGDSSSDSGSDSGTASGGSNAGSNPCDVVSQEQWETLFGVGVTKSDASGGADNCNVLTEGNSPGHEISLTNFSASQSSTFDEQLGFNTGCGGAAEELSGVGDRAVVDTSCVKLSGRAWVIAESSGDVVGIFFDAGEPSDVAAETVKATLTEIATDALAAR